MYQVLVTRQNETGSREVRFEATDGVSAVVGELHKEEPLSIATAISGGVGTIFVRKGTTALYSVSVRVADGRVVITNL